MCGIVAVLGPNAHKYVPKMLQRIEYRGYDSHGYVTINHDCLNTLKFIGPPSAKLDVFAELEYGPDIVVGHTRWATHGEVSIRNTHPHDAPNLKIVHNGTFNSYQNWKQVLEASSYEFSSDTDTEILINSMYLLGQGGKS